MSNQESPYYLYKPPIEKQGRVRSVWITQKDDGRVYTTVGVEYLREQNPEPEMREYFDKYGPYWTVFSGMSEYSSEEEVSVNRIKYPLTSLHLGNPHIANEMHSALKYVLGNNDIQGEKRTGVEKFTEEVEEVLKSNHSTGVSAPASKLSLTAPKWIVLPWTQITKYFKKF